LKPLIKIAASLFIITLALYLLSALYGFALKQNRNIKASFVQKERVDADVLIHGPCEPLWMVSPGQLDKKTGLRSYNLALSHSDFADNYLHLYFYLKANKAPRVLFLYVTPESMDRSYNTFNTYRFAPYVGDPEVDTVLKENDPEYYRWSRFPFMRYAYYNNRINFEVLQGIKHYLTGRKKPHFADGYEPPLQIVWDNHMEELMQLYPEGYRFKWDALREKYLKKTITLALKNNIRVYLYESPVLKESLHLQPNRGEIIRRIRSIAGEYGIKYVQFSDMEIAGSRDYFMSALNTNLKGSAIFNDSLGNYIKKECFQ
jgi:hypothetical protein